MDRRFVDGWDECERALFKQVPQMVIEAVQQSSDVPVDTGELRDSIVAEDIQRSEGRLCFTIAATAEHAYILDKGINKDPIVPNGRSGGGGKALYWPGARHPVPSVSVVQKLNRYRGWYDKATNQGIIDKAVNQALTKVGL